MNDCVFEMDLGNRGCLVVEVEPLHFGLVDGGSCTCVRGREGILKLPSVDLFKTCAKMVYATKEIIGAEGIKWWSKLVSSRPIQYLQSSCF